MKCFNGYLFRAHNNIKLSLFSCLKSDLLFVLLLFFLLLLVVVVMVWWSVFCGGAVVDVLWLLSGV